MVNINYILYFKNPDVIIQIIKMFCIILCTYYSFIKVTDYRNKTNIKAIICIISSIIIAVTIKIVQFDIFVYLSWIVIIFLVSLINYLCFNRDIIYVILVTIISLSISYVGYAMSVMIAFFPIKLLNIENELITLGIIALLYLFLMINVFKIKKFKYGISFLERKVKNQSLGILIFDIGAVTLLSLMVLQSYNGFEVANVGMTFAIVAIIMILTFKQSFNLYYKQNLLTKDLEQTKVELEEKKQEISKLEKENLEFSKTSHSLAHKQKSLEFKLEKLMKTGVDDKSKEAIKQEIQNISKEIYKEPQQIELPKTEIESIDDMFSYMQSECIKDNIKFELQIVGNPFYMINHLISESELEILLADHIKDAIIAINYSDNTNRSILVRIGKIDNVYALYIYDSGIEFEKEVLENLGKKPITTHADSGGTGMGFMNTFDTLNRIKASLIINEIGKPSIDNYTKVLIFKFDNKNEFIVNSYKNKVAAV